MRGGGKCHLRGQVGGDDTGGGASYLQSEACGGEKRGGQASEAGREEGPAAAWRERLVEGVVLERARAASQFGRGGGGEAPAIGAGRPREGRERAAIGCVFRRRFLR